MKAVFPLLLAFAIFGLMFAVSTSAPVTSPAYAGKMNGKPGGRMGGGVANYSQPNAKTKSKSNSGQ
jgi:hypothetical protein